MNIDRQPNMHDLSWFIDMHNQKRLELNPPYQRKSVWTPSDRYYFLDTIFNNYPCPAVYVQKEITADGPRYNVVDGKQRLSTIISFFQNKIRLPKKFSISRLSGRRFQDLDRDDVVSFYNYVFLVETLKASGDAEWNEVFFRVNKNQKGLTEQELRHARFGGWFITRAESEIEGADQAGQGFWSNLKISTSAKSRRMKDIEFVSILMLVLLENDFVGFPQQNIDNLYAKYDFELETLLSEDPQLESESEELDAVGDFGDEVAGSVSREDIEQFERNFQRVKDYVAQMEGCGNAVTSHSRRMATDFYSLWSVLSLSPHMMDFDASVFARAYDNFLNRVDAIYDAVRRDKSVSADNIEQNANVLSYYNNSIGAATTVVHRKARHDALSAFVQSYA